MTNNTTPTTQAAKAEAALRDYLPNTAAAHALLAVAEQLRIANLLTLVKEPLSEHIPCEPDCTDMQTAAVEALVNIKTHVVPTGIPPAPDEYVTAQLRPDIAAALGIELFDEQEQQ